MTTEQFTNFGQSTITASITNVATTCSVASASTFPSGGNFHVTIDTEILLVTAVSGTTFTISRGQESTTAASHSSGSTIALVLTASGITTTISEGAAASGTLSAQTSASRAGRTYFATDTPYSYRDTGSAWECYLGSQTVTVPTASSFTWLNQGTATRDNTYGFMTLRSPANAVNNIIGLYKATSGTSWTATALLKASVLPSGTQHYGLFISDNSGNKLITYSLQYNSAFSTRWNLAVYKWNSTSSFSASYNALDWTKQDELWLRIRSDATNLYWDYSADGSNWNQQNSQLRTNWLGSPAGVGVYTDAVNVNYPLYLGILSWSLV